MVERYKTVYRQAEAEITEKKSRFIAVAAPVRTEAEALDLINAVKKKHWNASHNVFAYHVGLERETRRMSDDGEPGGTAGLPMLDVLRGENLKNTLVVVTRYFGGTLLGTGGLIRTYARAAKEGVAAASVVEKALYAKLAVTVDYHLSGKVQHAALKNNQFIRDTVYADNVVFQLLVESGFCAAFTETITDITGGTAVVRPDGFAYGFFHEGELKVEPVS